MTFVPKFSARFEGPLIANVVAIVERDMKDALDYFYPADDLPDFVERSLGVERGLEFPIFVIGPRENLIETVDDDSHLVEPQRIEIKIGVVADSPDLAYEKIMKYVRAMDSVLRSASKSDYCANMGTDNGAPFGFILNVTHRYGPLGQDEGRTTYFKPASLELAIEFREF